MCKIEGCSGKAVARGLCAMHYMRVRRTGDPALTGKPNLQYVISRGDQAVASGEHDTAGRSYLQFELDPSAGKVLQVECFTQ